jgi:predicted regulator of Ras-like GTPase activity (Roadblock/LC7/MglB family)
MSPTPTTCARILADKGDYERAFDEWDMAVRIAPGHTGALKGLAFLYFKVGDVDQAVAHLESAKRHSPNDSSIDQALAAVRVAAGKANPRPALPRRPVEPAATAATAAPLRTRGCLPGSKARGRDCCCSTRRDACWVGALRNPAGADVTDAVAAYLAGVSQEAARTAKLLGLGTWTGLATEGGQGHVHLAQPTPEALLLVVRDRATPMGRLAIVAQRAAHAARRWLEQQG